MTANHRNICKFVPEKREKEINTTLFVYESQIPSCGSSISAGEEMLILVAEGVGTLTLDGEIHTLVTGQMFFVFRGETFRVENGGALAFFYIKFYGSRVNELYDRFGISRSFRSFSGMEGLIPVFRESLLRATEDNIDLLSESMLLYTLSRLAPRSREEVSVLHAVKDYLENNFKDPSCSLRQLASEIGYNEKYISHLFKQSVSIGVSEYLRNLRLRHAVLLMEGGITSIKNIAALSGFSDPLYFSKIFRSQFGSSPKQYLQKIEAESSDDERSQKHGCV